MKEMLPTFAKTFLLYVAALAALYFAGRAGSNTGAPDDAVGAVLMVVVAICLVLLGALLYAVYKAFTQSPNWWAVVALHFVLFGMSFVWLSR